MKIIWIEVRIYVQGVSKNEIVRERIIFVIIFVFLPSDKTSHIYFFTRPRICLLSHDIFN